MQHNTYYTSPRKKPSNEGEAGAKTAKVCTRPTPYDGKATYYHPIAVSYWNEESKPVCSRVYVVRNLPGQQAYNQAVGRSSISLGLLQDVASRKKQKEMIS